MNKNINILLNSLQDLDAFSDELERLEGEEYEKGLWDSTRPYSDVYDSLHMIYNYFPKTKEELREIIKERLIDAKQEDPNKIVNLNDIDVSEITDMSALFRLDEFKTGLYFIFNNVDVSMWDVFNVKNMSGMFDGCKNFNCNLSGWKVSNVKDMSEMFQDCKNFNCNLSRWDVSNVENMCGMFAECSSFNSNLKDWKVSKVKSMNCMFSECTSFNSDLSEWDVSNVDNMSFMFYGCTSFESDLSKWKNKVSNVEDMTRMFYGCTSFESDLSEWDVNVETIEFEMFKMCPKMLSNPQYMPHFNIP